MRCACSPRSRGASRAEHASRRGNAPEREISSAAPAKACRVARVRAAAARCDDESARLAETRASSLVDFFGRSSQRGYALRKRNHTRTPAGDPAALASDLDRRLKRFRSGRAFISYRESGDFARELEAWLDDVETQLLPADPQKAWKLVDRFIRTDEHVLGRADDSNGSIGDAFRRACALWHRTAAALPADAAWVERVHALHAGNDYGTRDAILDEAATRLSELELRRLARIYEQGAQAAPCDDSDYTAHCASVAMGQVACALGDAALHERSVTLRSPRPNGLQVLDIAEQYLRFGPVERAVEWLMRPDDQGAARDVDPRLALLAQAYDKLGDRAALLDVRRRLAERSLDAKIFGEYAALLPRGEREAARGEAIERAERSSDPVRAGIFLLDLGEGARAAALIVRGRERLSAAYYASLLALAKRLEKGGHPLAAVACYRALTEQILAAARREAYAHAKRYVDGLSALDARVGAYGEVATHETYLAELRATHGRKSSFWKLFE
jgi:hypothetical protein